ncbi:MAG: putative Ig domain-containing protein [Bacteroidota bacterium]
MRDDPSIKVKFLSPILFILSVLFKSSTAFGFVAPEITGQNTLSICEEESLLITLSDLTVNDPDNVFPDDFTLFIQDGTNYSRSGNTITPASGFSGILSVPITVSASGESSPVFNLQITVNALPFLDPTLTAEVCSDEASGLILTTGTGSPTASSYAITNINIPGGLTATAGNPITGSGLTNTEISDDEWRNQTATTLSVDYSIRAVSSNGCTGEVFIVSVDVLPEPLLEIQSVNICTEELTGIVLSETSGSVSATEFNLISINSNGLSAGPGNASPGNGLDANVIVNDVWSNSMNDIPVIVEYTIEPVSAEGCVGGAETISVTVAPDVFPEFTLSRNLVEVDEDFTETEIVSVTPIVPSFGSECQNIVYSIGPSITFATIGINEGTGEVSITSMPNVSGSQILTVSADDQNGTNRLFTQDFTLTINSVNDAPDFTLDRMTLDLEEDFSSTEIISVTPSSIPLDESSQIVTYSLSPTTIDFVDVSIDSSTGEIEIIAVQDSSGTQEFNVIANDQQSENNLAETTFTLNITPVNDPPEFSLSRSSVTVDEDFPTSEVFTTVPGSVPLDEENQNVIYSISPTSVAFANLDFDPSTGTVEFTAITDSSGTQEFVITANDQQVDNNTFSRSLIFEVIPVNDAPEFMLDRSEINVNEDFAIVQEINVIPEIIPFDELSQIVTYQLSPATVSFADILFENATGKVTVNAIPNVSGSQKFTIIANDQQGVNNEFSTTFQLTVSEVNDRPSFSISGTAATADEDAGTQTFENWISDIVAGPNEGSQSVSFVTNVVSTTGGLVFAVEPSINASGDLSFLTSSNRNGTAVIQVFALDNGDDTPPNNNQSPTQTFSIVVNAVNDPPSFARGNNEFIDEDGDPVIVSPWATAIIPGGGVDESAQNIQFLVNSTGTVGNLTFDSAPTISPNGSLNYNATPNTNGIANFEITIVDDGSDVSPSNNVGNSVTLSINVAAVNDPPEFVKGVDINLVEDDGIQTINSWASGIFRGGGSDESTQSLTFELISSTVSGNISYAQAPEVNEAGDLSFELAPDAFGEANVSIQLFDNGPENSPSDNSSEIQNFSITASPTQDDPIFTSTPVTGAIQGQLYSYLITADDPDLITAADLSALSFNSPIALPSWLQLIDNSNGTATLSGTPTNSDIGTFGIFIRLQDAQGNDQNQFFDIEVANSNDIPFFTSTANESATEGIAYNYFILTDDNDPGDVLNITAPTLPAWLNLLDNGDGSAILSGTPDNDDVGTNPVELRVTDNSDAFSLQNFEIVVENANQPPRFDSDPVLQVNEDVNYEYLIQASDEDLNDQLTISALSIPDWLELTDNNDGTAILQGLPSNSDVGVFNIVLNVEDLEGLNENQNFSLEVLNQNDAPSFSSSPVLVALQGEDYEYSVVTTDPDLADSRSIIANELPLWLSFEEFSNGTARIFGTPSNLDLGPNNVELQVIDLAGESVLQSFTITVDNANDPPSFSSTPLTNATEDNLYSYTITTNDPDLGDTRIITALSIPDWLSLNDNEDGTALLSGIPENSDVGSFGIVLNVRDAIGLDANQNFTVTVANVNDDPVFESAPPLSGVQGVSYFYSISTDDPDVGDEVTLELINGPSWLNFQSLGSGDGSLSGTPSNLNLGQNNVSLRAIDLNGGVTFQSFIITVNNTNDPPSFISSPITSIQEDEAYNYLIETQDPDVGDALVIRSLVLPEWLILMDNEDGTASLNGTPENSDVGTSNVVLEVEDVQGLSANQNFTITIVNQNDPPFFSSTPVTGAIQDQQYSYDVLTSDIDLGDDRTIIPVLLPSWLSLTDNNNGTALLTGIPRNSDLGGNNVSIRVFDAAGAAVDQSFIVNVDNANDPPSFESSPVLSVMEDQTYEYLINTSDPDIGDQRTIIALSLPDWLDLEDNEDGTAVLSGIPQNEDVGNFTVVLNVRDALGANVNQNFTISVSNTNDPPAFSSMPIPVAIQDLNYIYSIVTTDPDIGDERTLSVVEIPDWLSFTNFNNGNGELTGIPTNADLGPHNISLLIEDVAGAAIEQNFVINVDNINDPPFFTSNPIILATEDQLYSYIINTSDDDVGDIQTISALSIPDWLSLQAQGNGEAVLSGIPENEDVGSFSIVLEVTDGIGASANQSFNITVENTNDAPFFTSSPVTGAIQNVSYTYNITTDDVDATDEVSVSLISGPSWLSFNEQANGMATLQGIPTNADLGSNEVEIQVVDLFGASVIQAFTINVDNSNDPPSFEGNPLTTTNEDETYVYNITTSDPDFGDTRDIIAFIIPDWLSIEDNGDGTASLEGIPSNTDVGVSNVGLRVEDALGLTADQIFNITVINVNDVPQFESDPVFEASEDNFYEYTIITSDPDVGDNLELRAITIPTWLSFEQNSGNGRLFGTPTNDDIGSASIVLEVEDESGAAVQQVFSLLVNNLNDTPIFSSEPVESVDEDTEYIYTIVVEDSDLEDDLTISSLSIPNWLTLIDNGDRTALLSGTPSNDDVGFSNIVLNVSDQDGANTNQSFTLTINNVNDQPSFTSSPVQTAQQGLLYAYEITTNDPDLGDVVTISSVATLPSWLILSDNSNGALLSGTPTNLDLGSFNITLRAQDLAMSFVDQSFVITVDNVNDPPFFTSIPLLEIFEDSSYTYIIEVDDPDVGDILSVVTIDIPSWLSFSNLPDGTSLLSGVPGNSDVGTHSVSVQVTDIVGQTVTQNFDIEVSNNNDTPFFISDPPLNVLEDEEYIYSISGQDIDVGDDLILSSVNVPSWLSLFDNGDGTGELSGSPENSNVGVNAVSIQIEDVAGAFQIQSFDIIVANTNDSAFFTSTPVLIVNEDETYAYQASALDPDANDELTFSLINSPSGLELTDNNDGSADIVWVPENEDVGANDVTIQVTDLSGISVTQEYSIEVVNTNDPPEFLTTVLQDGIEDVPYEFLVRANDMDQGDNATIIPLTLPSWLQATNISSDSLRLTATPTNNEVGITNIVLELEDENGASFEQSFGLNIINTNDAPVFDSSPVLEIDEDSEYRYVLEVSDVDLMDNLMIFSSSLPTWLSLDIIGQDSALLSGTPLNENVGNAGVTISVKDNEGVQVDQSFVIEVRNTNDSPRFSGNEPQIRVSFGENYSYLVEVEDDDLIFGDQVSIEVLSLPNFLSFTNNGGGSGEISGIIPENLLSDNLISLRATDQSGDVATLSFNLELNNPPTLNDFEILTFEDSIYTFLLNDFIQNYSDDENDPIDRIILESLPSNGQLLSSSELLSQNDTIDLTGNLDLVFIPTSNFNGIDEIQVRVGDRISISELETQIEFVVQSVNDPPLIGNISNVPLAYSLGDAPITVADSITISDVDDTQIQSAIVTISENYIEGDLLELDIVGEQDLETSFDLNSGTLIIFGSRSTSAYASLIAQITYSSPVNSSSVSQNKQISFLVSDGEDSSSVINRVIEIEAFPELDLVNSFTPNGDGFNDEWDIINLENYSIIDISIYNTNGLRVFDCTSSDCLWDGTSNGEELPAGPYFYTIDLDNGRRTYEGTVTILKR